MENLVLLGMGNSYIFRLCFLFFIAGGTLAIPTDQSNVIDGHRLPPKPRVPLFVFGDSLYDPGNNNYINATTDFQANFLPYGETHFEFATGRFSNGLLMPDFIAKYAKLPLIPPYFMSSYRQFPHGVNFASGGGGALVETHEGKVLDLNKQLIYFNDVVKQLRTRLGNKETAELLSNAVYMFSIGGNDLLAPNPIFSSFSTEECIQIIVGNFSAVLKELYKVGGRKFGFINVLPLGCIPCVRVHNGSGNAGELCVEDITELTRQYNSAVSKEIKQLQKQLKGFTYAKSDLFTAVYERIHNPSKYGFKEVKSACCGSGVDRATYSCGGKRGEVEYELCENPEEHFFFDSYHPSQKAYEQLAELMWDGPPTFIAPYTLKSLFQLRSLSHRDGSEYCDNKN